MISLQELSLHNTSESCWIAIHGVVFDVTGFLYDHPGGADLLLEVAGTDATSAFENIGHTNVAKKMLEPLMIGILEGSNTNYFASM